jgi:hypothetical protein
MIYMALQNDDDNFENSIVVLSELRRLKDQMELQRLARIKNMDFFVQHKCAKRLAVFTAVYFQAQ